jgi:hypothetical protein
MTKMKKTLLAGALMMAFVSHAQATTYAITKNYNCTQSPTVAWAYQAFTAQAQDYNLPPPQIDYTTGANKGAVILTYIAKDTQEPQEILFFTDSARCQLAAEFLRSRYRNSWGLTARPNIP